jgi:hypothetical protein
MPVNYKRRMGVALFSHRYRRIFNPDPTRTWLTHRGPKGHYEGYAP